MKRGTKSLLFGVHQFLWHPIVVGRTWRRLYGRKPTAAEWIAIVTHDWGYWGCDSIDGPQGVLHPERSARIGCWIARRLGASESMVTWLIRGHSREYAKRYGYPISALCWPDKFSIVFESTWFYLLRGILSGEITEFRANAIKSGHISHEATRKEWLLNYTVRTLCNSEIIRLLRTRQNEKHSSDAALSIDARNGKS
jgi:hypothetical protein